MKLLEFIARKLQPLEQIMPWVTPLVTAFQNTYRLFKAVASGVCYTILGLTHIQYQGKTLPPSPGISVPPGIR